METIEAFFRALDAGCDLEGRPRGCFHVIGSAALMFQTDYERGTRDSDVIEAGLPDDVRAHRSRSAAAVHRSPASTTCS